MIAFLFFVVLSMLMLSAYAQHPNIVFIESDDRSNQAVDGFAHPDMISPNIDQLAEEGIAFTSAYNMGCWSPADCVPSRPSTMNKQY